MPVAPVDPDVRNDVLHVLSRLSQRKNLIWSSPSPPPATAVARSLSRRLLHVRKDMPLLVVLVWGRHGHGDIWFVPLPDQRLWLRKIHWPRQSASGGRLELRSFWDIGISLTKGVWPWWSFETPGAWLDLWSYNNGIRYVSVLFLLFSNVRLTIAITSVSYGWLISWRTNYHDQPFVRADMLYYLHWTLQYYLKSGYHVIRINATANMHVNNVFLW